MGNTQKLFIVDLKFTFNRCPPCLATKSALSTHWTHPIHLRPPQLGCPGPGHVRTEMGSLRGVSGRVSGVLA